MVIKPQIFLKALSFNLLEADLTTIRAITLFLTNDLLIGYDF